MSIGKLSPQRGSPAARSAAGILLSHHAFRMQCASEEEFKIALQSVVKELEESGRSVDVWSRTYETLVLGDKQKGERFVEEICDRARDSVARASSADKIDKNESRSQELTSVRLVAVFFARANREAQNALLKTLEEPPETTKIILATLSPSALLPTIISRTIELRGRAPTNTEVEPKVQPRAKETCVQMTKAERLEYIKDIVENKKIAEARELVNGLVDEVGRMQVSSRERIRIQTQLLALDRELENGAPMLKMVLEAAVLLVP